MRAHPLKIELLAPAKNSLQGKTAILAGADAVYIGPQKFGARSKVGNSVVEIESLINFAAPYHARVYVTLNTLLFDDEIEEAVTLTHRLAEIGIDGIIIQDMGLLECNLPSVPLIASTQCFCNTPEKAKFFQDLGFSRIILPRELDLAQIQKIHDAAPEIKLEYFIHGALCVSFSGQCYMSQALGGRSGNRGVCAQPCRKKYSLYDSEGNLLVKDKHLLSLKDLNQSNHLDELLDAGITSFKIEGRLKDENYVKNTVSFYRKKLDRTLSRKGLTKTSSGHSIVNFSPDPDKTFNRGYTDYFIKDKQMRISSIDTPKMKGEWLGRVQSVTETSFQIKTEVTLSNGDGICFFVDNKLSGTNINRASGNTIVPDSMTNISPGLEIFRNYDHEFMKKISNQKIERKIELSIGVTEKDGYYRFSATDEDHLSAEIISPKAPAAEQPDNARKVLINNLKKCGTTVFTCNDVNLELDSIPFLKRSEINDIRRKLLDQLLAKRIAQKPKHPVISTNSEVKYITCQLDFRGNVINNKAREFYKKQGVQSIETGAETGLDLIGKPVMTTKYCLRKELGQCLKEKTSPCIPDWKLSDEAGNIFTLKFRCNPCEMDVLFEKQSEHRR